MWQDVKSVGPQTVLPSQGRFPALEKPCEQKIVWACQPFFLLVAINGAGIHYKGICLGVASFAVFVLSTLLSFVEKEGMGTLEKLEASPPRSWETIYGYSAAFSVLGGLQAVVHWQPHRYSMG